MSDAPATPGEQVLLDLYQVIKNAIAADVPRDEISKSVATFLGAYLSTAHPEDQSARDMLLLRIVSAASRFGAIPREDARNK